jgi:hypothetical protein
MKWAMFGLVGLAGVYAVLFVVVLSAMLQPPARFGQFMKYMPGILVWVALPAPRMWLWARDGVLKPGDAAPDFTLQKHGGDGRDRVSLSSHRGQRPVVLVFGSYT